MAEDLSQARIRTLAEASLRAREAAYAPYSHFAVGAAVLSAEGTVYSGCNIENASYGASNCAERTAVFKAVSEGTRTITAIAIAGGPEQEKQPASFCPPCGICRQVLREFCDPERMTVILVKSPENWKIMKLSELLPESFGPGSLF
ncbi:MAG: cytidine deaminase [Lachnospiraceae bacterium]|nr:cytidine deaminase [Lachnospiraceae bacterium]